MPVSTNHPEYIRMLPKWELMKDVLTERVKEKGEVYLPRTAGQKAIAVDEIYKAYLARADFQSYASDSLRSMVGLVSRLEATINLPDSLKSLETNATADGFSLKALFDRTVENSLGYGRQGLLVDIDHAGKPYIACYNAFSIINWKETNNNGRKDLTLVVLVEHWLRDKEDSFGHSTEIKFRVLDLNEQGKYRVRIYKQNGTLEEDKTDVLRGIDYIPFIFVGSTDTSPSVDPIPLWTMAKCSIKSYQISADYYHDLHLTCHPQAWVSGLTADDEIAYTGSNMIWKIPQGGACGYLEISGNGIERNRIAMQDLKNTALESGARVIDIGVESGEAREARQNDQHATLHSVVKVAADAINQAITYMLDIKKISFEGRLFTVTIDFKAAGIDATILTNLFNAVMANKISSQTYWDYLHTGKLPSHSYDKEVKLIEEQQDAQGLSLDEPA